jgi:hypothetical protein
VANVLAVQAGEVGNPITSVVLTESDDPTQHEVPDQGSLRARTRSPARSAFHWKISMTVPP